LEEPSHQKVSHSLNREVVVLSTWALDNIRTPIMVSFSATRLLQLGRKKVLTVSISVSIAPGSQLNQHGGAITVITSITMTSRLSREDESLEPRAVSNERPTQITIILYSH
jgi:hypothetical protein